MSEEIKQKILDSVYNFFISSHDFNDMPLRDVSKKFETVIDEVKQGEALSVSIQRTGIFESMFTSIIYVGEESGALDSILAKSAAFYQEEADEAVSRLVGLIEPVMIIFMGTAIGLVIAGILPATASSEKFGMLMVSQVK